MKDFRLAIAAAVVAIGVVAGGSFAKQAATAGQYKVLKTAKLAGEGGFDYIFADPDGRRLYVPRIGSAGLMVFDLDTLDQVGSIPLAAGGAAVDPISHHGFSTTRPLTMWDSQTLKVIKTIDVERPDAIMYDPFNERIWVFGANATVINGADGTVVGIVDLGGRPEQGVSDGKGTIYVNLINKNQIAVVDAKTLTVKAHYDISSAGVTPYGLSLDPKNHILFSYVQKPTTKTIVVVNADTGQIITTIQGGDGVDTAVFNPNTMEAITADVAGTMTFIKENSPTSFTLEQSLTTMPGTRTCALDPKTGHVFTMSAEFGPPPPPDPASRGRGGQGPLLPGTFTVFMVGK